jgi:Rrf2 family protein
MSEAAALALHAMVLIAARHGGLVSTKCAAEELGVSEAHLSKVLQRLAKDGLVISERGREGGFMLGKPAERTLLLDIYESIEGKCAESRCLFTAPVCGGGECILGGIIEDVDGQLRRYLAGTKLSELAGIYTRKKGNAAKDN